MFDSPCPMNSWLPSMNCPDRAASERAMDTASASANRVTAKATGASSRKVAREKSGTESGGSAAATVPTRVTERSHRTASRTAFTINAIAVPARIAGNMYGTRGMRRRETSPAPRVVRPTRAAGGLIESALNARNASVPKASRAAGTCTPRKCSSWLIAMRIAAPAVNPTMTGWDTKFTSTPSRAMPSANWMTPTIRVRVIA